MKTRYLLLFLTVFTFVISIFTNGTFAWFTDVVSYHKTYEIGDISYVFSGSLVSSNIEEIVVPGQELITSGNLFLTNHSKIDTNLRIQIHFSYVDQVSSEVVTEIYTGDALNQINDFLLIDMGDNWIFDENDNCFHYLYESSYTIPSSTQEGYSFILINSIAFDGEKVDNTLSGAIFNIQIIFQAKQMQFVNWVTIGTEDIENLVTIS